MVILKKKLKRPLLTAAVVKALVRSHHPQPYSRVSQEERMLPSGSKMDQWSWT